MWGCGHGLDIAVIDKHVNYRHCDADDGHSIILLGGHQTPG
jgi:hypothetical protein